MEQPEWFESRSAQIWGAFYSRFKCFVQDMRKSRHLSLLRAPWAAYGLAGLVGFSRVSNQIIFLPMSSQELRWDTPPAISLWFLVNRMHSASSFNVPSMQDRG